MTSTDTIAQAIRTAYADTVQITGSPDVQIAWIREDVSRYQRADVDAALIHLSCQGDVRIYPQSNQKTLSPAEKAGAVRIGNQERHLIRIG